MGVTWQCTATGFVIGLDRKDAVVIEVAHWHYRGCWNYVNNLFLLVDHYHMESNTDLLQKAGCRVMAVSAVCWPYNC